MEQPQFNRAQPLARPAEQLQFNRAQPVARPVEQPQFNRAQPFARPVEQPQFNRAQAVVRAPPKSTYTSSTKDDFEKPERRFKNTKKPTAQVPKLQHGMSIKLKYLIICFIYPTATIYV